MFAWAFVAKYAPFFVNGAWMTLFISVFGIALAILTGIICAAIETARIPVLRQITTVYIEVSRNTPLLVQLYFLYFGLPKMGFVWSAELCAIVGLLTRVIVPQAVSISTPGIVANVIFLIKESSVVSAIALADVMYMAKDLMGMYYNTYEALFMLIVTYLIILLPISILGTWLERRFDYARR